MLLVRPYSVYVLIVLSFISTLLPIVPPSITHSLPTGPVNRNRNEPLSFTIEFNSRFEANTTVTWFHDNDVIRNEITTQFTSEYEGRSTLDLGTVSRSDRGSYRVEVYNNFSSISETQRKVRSSVDLSVMSEFLTNCLC